MKARRRLGFAPETPPLTTNRDRTSTHALVDYWTGRIATGEFLRRLQHLRQPQAGGTA